MKTPTLTPEEIVSAQLQKVAADLLAVYSVLKLKPRGINGGTLAEFRQMIDIVRHTAITGRAWLESHNQPQWRPLNRRDSCCARRLSAHLTRTASHPLKAAGLTCRLSSDHRLLENRASRHG